MRKGNRWREVIAACALAESDERGYFPTRAVVERMGAILGAPMRQQTIAYHLGELLKADRGPLLERTGPRRRFRYRFVNPLMRPYVRMVATRDGLVAS